MYGLKHNFHGKIPAKRSESENRFPFPPSEDNILTTSGRTQNNYKKGDDSLDYSSIRISSEIDSDNNSEESVPVVNCETINVNKSGSYFGNKNEYNRIDIGKSICESIDDIPNRINPILVFPSFLRPNKE